MAKRRARAMTRTRTVYRRARSYRPTRRGVKRSAILSGRSVGRALTYNLVSKNPWSRALGPFALPANLVVSGGLSRALKNGGNNQIQTGIEIGISRALDTYVIPMFLGGRNGARNGIGNRNGLVRQ